MVNLKFSVMVPRPLEEVFGYFSRFETISEWDPNVRESKLRRNLENRLGQEYDLITVWKGQATKMTYRTTQYEHLRKVVLFGETDRITSRDTLLFEAGQQPGTTKFTYKASIEFKGFLKLFTVFVVYDLHKLAEDTERGVLKRCQELFPQRV